MKQEMRYLISDAAKKVAVESHVLRYWEEELKLPIKRNELGHRYYTEEDILRFQEVKSLKEQGLQLKAIRMILKGGKLEPFTGRENVVKPEFFTGREIAAKPETYIGREAGSPAESREPEHKHILMVNSSEIMAAPSSEPAVSESREAKSLRLQQLLQQMIAEAVRTNNRELCDEIRETMLKELDYQFRLQEEREEERIKEQTERDECHYQRIDELIRNRNRRAKPDKKGKKMSAANTVPEIKENNGSAKENKKNRKFNLFKKA